jgi:hypothetical protein
MGWQTYVLSEWPYPGLGLVRAHGTLIHGFVDFCSIWRFIPRVRLGSGTRHTDPWVGGLLFCLTVHTQDKVTHWAMGWSRLLFCLTEKKMSWDSPFKWQWTKNMWTKCHRLLVKIIQWVCLSLCDKPSKFTRSEYHILGWTGNPSTETECHSSKLSQQTVCWVDASFGSKCCVVGLSVDGWSRHRITISGLLPGQTAMTEPLGQDCLDETTRTTRVASKEHQL